MANDSAVAPIFPLAARNVDALQQSATPQSGYIRNGSLLTFSQTTDLWGFAAVAQALALGLTDPAATLAAGAMSFLYSVPLLTRKPAATLVLSKGLFVFDVLLNWPTALVGKESGVIAQYGIAVGGQTCRRPVTVPADNAIAVYNDAGTLKFLSRGPNGAETVDLSAFQVDTVSEWNRVGLELHHATSSAFARLDVKINDRIALSRQWTPGHKLPVAEAPTRHALSFWLGQNDLAVPLYFRDAHYSDGPDAPGI